MENARRDIVYIGSSLLFLDSINFFRLDPDGQKTLFVYGPEVVSEEIFATKENAKKSFGDLAKKIMLKKNILLFGDYYIITDKISCYLLEEDGDSYSLKVFFENGQMIRQDFLIDSMEALEELSSTISDFNLGKVFSVGGILTCAFYKVKGLHLAIFENGRGYIVEVLGHQIPICTEEENLKEVFGGLLAVNDINSEVKFS